MVNRSKVLIIGTCHFADCVPEASNNEVDSDKGLLIQKVRKTLQEATPSSPNKPPPNYDLVHSKVTLQALGLQLGDKIVVSGIKVCIQFTSLSQKLLLCA